MLSNYAVKLENNLEFFPLDGTSAYIEHAELSGDGTKAYLRFNKPFTGAIPAAADVRMIKANPNPETAGATGVTRLGNSVLWVDFGTGFASASSPNQSVWIEAGFPGQNTYIAADYGNQATYRVALHALDVAYAAAPGSLSDPRIDSITVGPGSSYIDVTFDQAVSSSSRRDFWSTAQRFLLGIFLYDGSIATATRLTVTSCGRGETGNTYRLSLDTRQVGSLTGTERVIIRASSSFNSEDSLDNRYYATDATIFSEARLMRTIGSQPCYSLWHRCTSLVWQRSSSDSEEHPEASITRVSFRLA